MQNREDDQAPFSEQPYGDPVRSRRPLKKSHKARNITLSLLAGFLVFIIIGALASGGSKTATPGATGPARSTAAVAPAADGGSYASMDAILAALDKAGVACSDASPVAGSTVRGSFAADGCNSPGNAGSSTTDSVVELFDDHADAQAYAQNMLSMADALGGSSVQEVVGVNWAVNTEPPYGAQIAAKLGGVLSTATGTVSAAVQSTAAPSTTVVLSKSGSGISRTKQFTIANDDWSISYSFDCASFGSRGNFQIYVYDDGGDLVDVPANALAARGKDTVYETGGPGTFSLELNSECSWTVKVTDGDSGQ